MPRRKCQICRHRPRKRKLCVVCRRQVGPCCTAYGYNEQEVCCVDCGEVPEPEPEFLPRERGRPSSAGRALQDARQADELCRPSSAGRIGSEWRSSFGGKLPLFSFYRYSRFPLFPFYRIDEDCNLVQPQLGATWCLVCPLFSFSRSGPNRPVVSRSGTSPEFWLKPILVRFQWRARFKYGSRWSAAIRARPCGFKATTPSTT